MGTGEADDVVSGRSHDRQWAVLMSASGLRRRSRRFNGVQKVLTVLSPPECARPSVLYRVMLDIGLTSARHRLADCAVRVAGPKW